MNSLHSNILIQFLNQWLLTLSYFTGHFFPLESCMLYFEQSMNNSTVINSFTDILKISEVFRYMQIIY